MSDNWEEVYAILSNIKIDVTNQSKRVLKKEIPKTVQVQSEISNNLVTLFNKATHLIREQWYTLDSDQQIIAKDIFSYIRDKTAKAFEKLGLGQQIPTSIFESIKIVQNNDMATTKVEFFNLASKIVSQQFAGEPEKAQSFFDSLELLQTVATGYDADAVAFVKTKLTSKARDYVTTENSLADVINTLKNKIKYAGSQATITKLLACRQNNKNTISYSEEIEKLADSLKRSFINEGVPPNIAEKYSTENVVKTLSSNANSERTRIVMQASTFNNVQEALEKFNSVNEINQTSATNIFYTGNNKRYNKANRNIVQNRKSYGNRNVSSSFRSGQQHRADTGRNNRRYNTAYNKFNNRYGHNRSNAVRVANSENWQDPRPYQLGEIQGMPGNQEVPQI